MVKRPLIALFIGTGALLASDVSNALSRMGIEHAFLNEEEIRDSYLREYRLLIVPGGMTRLCMKHLSQKAKENILSFVKDGNAYIGICMGAYIASGIGLVKSKLRRERGEFITKIRIISHHKLSKGYEGDVDIYYQNGPKIKPNAEDKIIATYLDGSAAIITSKYGKGRVVLFSPHPEKITATFGLLKNAIEYCLCWP